MEAENYIDIEAYIRQSGAAPSLGLMRPLFPRWRRQLRENGVERVSVYDTLSSNLMTGFIWDAASPSVQDRKAMHDHRNLQWAVGTPMLRERGWKD
jgi:hypothetical protein